MLQTFSVEQFEENSFHKVNQNCSQTYIHHKLLFEFSATVLVGSDSILVKSFTYLSFKGQNIKEFKRTVGFYAIQNNVELIVISLWSF